MRILWLRSRVKRRKRRKSHAHPMTIVAIANSITCRLPQPKTNQKSRPKITKQLIQALAVTPTLKMSWECQELLSSRAHCMISSFSQWSKTWRSTKRGRTSYCRIWRLWLSRKWRLRQIKSRQSNQRNNLAHLRPQRHQVPNLSLINWGNQLSLMRKLMIILRLSKRKTIKVSFK